MLKYFFLFVLLSSSISNIIAFQQPELPTNEGEPTKWMASSVLKHDGSRVYYAISDLPMTYDEAHDYCKSEKGYLAEPRSPEETEEIGKFIDGRNAWIGLNDRGTEALFIWDSDGQNAESYHNWGPDEPSGDGDCVHLATWESEQWNDITCDRIEGPYINPMYALCQRVA